MQPAIVLVSCEFLNEMFMKLDCVRIQSHQFVQGTSVPEILLLIRDDFTYDAYHYGIKTTVKSLSQNRIKNLKRWSHIQEAIRYLSNCDVSGKKDVLREMICSMGHTPVGKKKYEIETLIRAFEYFSISRFAYFRFRRDYELPSVDTLTRIASKVRNAGVGAFLNQIFGSLENRQKTCYLLIIIITEIQFSGYEEPLGIARYVVKLYRMMFPYNVQFVFKIV